MLFVENLHVITKDDDDGNGDNCHIIFNFIIR